MPSTMFLTMVVCFALSISVGVSIGLASLVGAWQADLKLLAIVKEMFGAIFCVFGVVGCLVDPRRQELDTAQ